MEKESIIEFNDLGKKDLSGFSEVQVDLDVEFQAGKTQKIQLFTAAKQSKNKHLSRAELLAVYHAVTEKLSDLITFYCQALPLDPKKVQELEGDLRKFQIAHDVIVNNLVWEKNKDLRKDMIPQEVWDTCGI